MSCPTCGFENGPDAAFCSNCGNSLSVVCSNCGASAAPDAVFCSTCGAQLQGSDASDLSRYVPDELMAKLEAARSGRSMVGERRAVTMLFADLQGSTAAAETMDPEEWADIVNGAFRHLIKPVYRYEGTLARLMGDGVLAFFGAPIAHEDDPERAIRAGLAMLRDARPYAHQLRQEIGLDLNLRVGVNTGLVVVGEVGSDLRVEYTALGDAVNLAARMEQTAEPGTLQVSEATMKLAEQLFEFESLGGIEVKGKADPVSAFRVVGVKERPETTRGISGVASPMVGREVELDVLKAAVDSVMEGTGAIASIIGEAGVGKSRLLAALEHSLGTRECVAPWMQEEKPRPGTVQWAKARCLSFDSSIPYAPFIDLFSRLFGIEVTDSPEIARARVETAMTSVLGDVGVDHSIYVCSMLGIDLDADAGGMLGGMEAPELQRRTFDAIISYVEGCSADRPSVLVIEDLHWADSVSLALTEQLAEITYRGCLGLVTLMRPYKEDPSWAFHEMAVREYEHSYSPLRLSPLPGDDLEQLVRGLLRSMEPDADVVASIVERSGGNPFFAEELARTVLESPDGSNRLPETISGLLTARLDRLEPTSKLVSQLGSVLGREFEFGELGGLVGSRADVNAAVRDLMKRGLLEERSRIPARHFAFRHALIQEAAYESMLLKTRRQLHGQVAESLIARGGDAPSIARHLVNGGQGSRAVPYLIEAAAHAARAMSLADAIRLYTEAGSYLGELPDTELALKVHDGLGSVYSLIPDLTGASSTYQKLLSLGRATQAPAVQVTALNRLGFATAALGGDLDQATLYLEEARMLAEENGDLAGLAEYHMASCLIASTLGDFVAAAAHDEQTASIGDQLDAPELRVGGLIQRAMSLASDTEFEEGRRALEVAKEAAGESTDPSTIAGLAVTEHFFLAGEGRFVEAMELLRPVAELTKRAGAPNAALIATRIGALSALLGNFEDAIAWLSEGLRLAEGSAGPGASGHAAVAAAALVGVYSDLGISDKVTDDLTARAWEHFGGPLGSMMGSSVHSELGWAALRLGHDDEGLRLFNDGLAGSSSTRYFEEPAMRLGAALALLHLGDPSTASEYVEQTESYLDDRLMRSFDPLVALVGAAVSGTLDPAGAIARLEGGIEAAQRMQMGRIEWRMHAALALIRGLAGDDDGSASAYARSRELIEELSNRFVDEALRETFRTNALAVAEKIALPH